MIRYGPGKRIDTNKPFILSVSFTAQNDKLTTVHVINHIVQGNQFDACNQYPDYPQWMGKSLPGMVYGNDREPLGDRKWRNVMARWEQSGCQGACDLSNSKMTFSNIRIDDL